MGKQGQKPVKAEQEWDAAYQMEHKPIQVSNIDSLCSADCGLGQVASIRENDGITSWKCCVDWLVKSIL